ncbi:MAG: NlpC/P60 family protein, partial [Okeania sp. SIO2D1]|nr:NlpC/P60 family protein [Okeania sp. SIO2D1]
MLDHQLSNVIEYQCQDNINIYDSSECNLLATQAAIGRNLQVIQLQEKFDSAILVKLQEDDYQGWLKYTDIDKIQPTKTPFQPHIFDETEIREKLPEAIA